MKNLYVVIVLLFSFIQSYAQNGPGGVGNINSSDVMLWLKADDLSLSHGAEVTQWSDVTGYGNNATNVSGNGPTYNSSGSYPVVSFTATSSDFLTVSDDPSLNPTAGLSMFVVASYKSTSSAWSPFITKTVNSPAPHGYAMAKNNNNDNTFAFVNEYDVGGRVDYPNNSSGPVRLIEFDYDKSSVNGRLGESDLDSKIYTNVINNNSNPLYIGSLDGTQAYLDGSIAEIVLLNRGVNDAERIIIANYLYGKYNLTLNANKYWDYDATYDKDIIGVGISGTSEHTSSQNDVLSLELSDGTTLSKSGFLLAGNNDKDIIGDSNCGKVPDVSTFKSSKEWKMDFSTLKGKLTITVDFTNTNFVGAIGSSGLNHNNDVKLLWSSDPGDYTSSNSGYILGTADIANNKWTFVYDNIDLNGIVYFSVGVGRGVEYKDGSTLKYIDDGTDADISTADGFENLKISSGIFEIPENTVSKVYYGRVDVSSGAELKINSNSTLMYICGVTNNGTVNVEDGASIVPGLGIRNACSGTFNVKRISPAYPNDYLYSYWSSPVYQPKLGSVFHNGTNDVTPNDYYSFEGISHTWITKGVDDKMLVGKGYAITGADGKTGEQERIFTGSLTTIDVDVDVFKGAGTVDEVVYNDFNLVGNPYASALDLNIVYTDNSGVWDGVAYLYKHENILPGWTNNPDDYITTTATGSNPFGTDYRVGTAQGFMIKSGTGGKFKFNTDQEFKTSGNNTQFYKKSPIKRMWLVMGSNDFSTSTLLGFTDKATDARDPKYDGLNISGSNDLQFYSMIDKGRYSVQATDSDIQSKSISLGYLAGADGRYTISILQNELTYGTEVYLEDKVSGITNWDLTKSGYEFDVENTNKERVNDRFVVSFTKNTLSTPKQVDLNEIGVSINENVLSVSLKNNIQISSIEMYSTSGKLIESWKGNVNNKYLLNSSVSNGVYIVRAYTPEGVFVKKVKL